MFGSRLYCRVDEDATAISTALAGPSASPAPETSKARSIATNTRPANTPCFSRMPTPISGKSAVATPAFAERRTRPLCASESEWGQEDIALHPRLLGLRTYLICTCLGIVPSAEESLPSQEYSPDPFPFLSKSSLGFCIGSSSPNLIARLHSVVTGRLANQRSLGASAASMDPSISGIRPL